MSFTRGAVQFEKATTTHVAWLAAIHGHALPDDFLPRLGRAFLETVYYPAALRSAYGSTLVATVDGRPIGFVTIAHDSSRFLGDVIRRHLLATCFYVFRAALVRPQVAFQALGLGWSMVFSRPDTVHGEIVFIAVDSAHRSAGVGSGLVTAALAYLADHHVSRCRTKTLAANEGVIEMYRRLGWQVRDRFLLIGREYVTIVSPLVSAKGVNDEGPDLR